MAGSDLPPIFVGLPVYRGWDFLDEALRSIQGQDFQAYRVMMSVDGGDQRSAGICARYSGDSRFELVLQPDHLGWARHINWLMARCPAEFFCYWQQDDYCSSSYLQSLYDHLRRHPEAVCAYADLQCVGKRTERYELASVQGEPLGRVLDRIGGDRSFIAFRGLIRARALAAAGPLRLTDSESCLEDEVWVTKLAGAGELHRVPGPLYFKRHHSANTHAKWLAWPPERWRSVWIEWGLGMLEASLPLADTSVRGQLLRTVVERLTVPRPGRHLWYDPSKAGATELVCFVADFLDRAHQRFGLDAGEGIRGLSQASSIDELLVVRQERLATSLAFAGESHFTEAVFGDDVGERLLLDAAVRRLWFARLRAEAAQHGSFEATFAAGAAGTSLLGRGWSTPEPWGVWSSASTADIRLPLPAAGTWHIVLRGNVYVDGLLPGAVRSARVRIGDHELWSGNLRTPGLLVKLILPPNESGDDRQLCLDFPDAVSPLGLGHSADPRRICFALCALSGQRCSAEGVQ